MKDVKILLPLTSDEDHQAYHLHFPTCSSLSPKSNPKSVCSLLCSITGSSSSSSNFPNCSSPRESSFSFHQLPEIPLFLSPSQRPCITKPEATFPSSIEPSVLRSFTRLFALPSPLNFLQLLLTATGPGKAAYLRLKHLPRLGMDFLLHIFNLSWTLHSFSSIWKIFFIIPIH